MKKEIISHCCFSGHLQSNGHDIHLQCVSWYKNTAQLSTYLDDNKIDLVIGIHAVRAGKLLCGESVRQILFLKLTGQNYQINENASFCHDNIDNDHDCDDYYGNDDDYYEDGEGGVIDD